MSEEEKVLSSTLSSKHTAIEKHNLSPYLCWTITIPPIEEDEEENLMFEGVSTILGVPEFEAPFMQDDVGDLHKLPLQWILHFFAHL